MRVARLSLHLVAFSQSAKLCGNSIVDRVQIDDLVAIDKADVLFAWRLDADDTQERHFPEWQSSVFYLLLFVNLIFIDYFVGCIRGPEKVANLLSRSPAVRTIAWRRSPTARVSVEGIDSTYIAIKSGPEIFSRMIKGHEFDVSEMSASTYLSARTRGDFPFVAIPVFPSKVFRHGYIFINKNSGIEKPVDLAGRRVGTMGYGQTAAVWIRGMLQDDHGDRSAIDTMARGRQ